MKERILYWSIKKEDNAYRLIEYSLRRVLLLTLYLFRSLIQITYILQEVGKEYKDWGGGSLFYLTESLLFLFKATQGYLMNSSTKA